MIKVEIKISPLILEQINGSARPDRPEGWRFANSPEFIASLREAMGLVPNEETSLEVIRGLKKETRDIESDVPEPDF